jgi:dihydropteroate synthase
MTARFIPVAGHGKGGFHAEDSIPLAGSAWAWFALIDIEADDGTVEEVLTGDLTPDLRDLLSRPRPDLLGLGLDRPRVMGILNVTPDSFSDGGDHADSRSALARARLMAESADILDIGGESTRPGADEVTIDEEIGRVVPVISAIRDAGLTIPVSVDTRKAQVAAAALDAGADMVNDVSAGLFDPEMLPLVAERGVPYCLMHMPPDPKTMQAEAIYDDVVGAVFDHLEARIDAAQAAGVARDRIIADPGIGFGKTLQHNLSILRRLTSYHALGVPLLVGASRKRFIGTIGGAEDAKDRLGGSVAVALYAADRGAHILRVHDTYETRQALSLHLALHERGE